jgi:hypothetical protein
LLAKYGLREYFEKPKRSNEIHGILEYCVSVGDILVARIMRFMDIRQGNKVSQPLL